MNLQRARAVAAARRRRESERAPLRGARTFFAALTLCALALSSFAAEPPKGTPSVADMANFKARSRAEAPRRRQAEGGELNVYHVYPALTAVLNAFTSKYGIKVKAWRSGSEGVLQKVVSEARGNRFEADIVQNNAPENEAAHREKLLQPVNSPLQKDLMPEASPAHKEWVGITLDVFVAAYNTGK
jgi:iron(III) transport system substrate-binding protein